MHSAGQWSDDGEKAKEEALKKQNPMMLKHIRDDDNDDGED